MSLYVTMALLFGALAALQAADAALVNFSLLPWFNGMRWLRVHFITLGALTEVLFGALPLLVARLQGKPRPAFRADIWLALNGGIIALLVGVPLVNPVPIYAGGGLVFTATLLLLHQLWGLRGGATAVSAGRKFYLMGLAFFLVGILIGTGLWFGWSDWLRIAVPLEAHIHANNWGLMSLVFAGLIVDLYPRWAKRPLARPRSVGAIFWLMSAGALLLVLGPWFNSLLFTVPGLVLHLSATGLLLANMVQPLWGDRAAWTPGLAHLITGYTWIIAPLLVAPFIILGVENVPGPAIESNAPQALIYGWLLQVGFAILPYFFRRLLRPGRPAALGGSWLSLAAAHLGGLFLWLGIFLVDGRALLHGLAYALWTMALLPFVSELYGIARDGLAHWEGVGETAVSPTD
ncbi:MAG: hypothetical protein KC425_05490 [Anaerolineales bacterium]|nr:hypothetical protein [Anaerolineales bacterium]